MKRPLSLINTKIKHLQEHNETKTEREGKNLFKQIKSIHNEILFKFDEVSDKLKNMINMPSSENSSELHKIDKVENKIDIQNIEIDEEEKTPLDINRKSSRRVNKLLAEEEDTDDISERRIELKKIQKIMSNVKEITSEIKKEISEQGHDLCKLKFN